METWGFILRTSKITVGGLELGVRDLLDAGVKSCVLILDNMYASFLFRGLVRLCSLKKTATCAASCWAVRYNMIVGVVPPFAGLPRNRAETVYKYSAAW